MYGYRGLFQETVFYELDVIWSETVAVVVASKTIDNISFLLHHPLEEEEHVHANVEEHPSRADIVVYDWELGVSYIRDYIMLILVAWFHAKVVNFDSNPMLLLQESNDILSFVSYC